MARTILVVDDSDTFRQMVSMTLAGAKFDVVTGANGQDGLAKLAAKKVDLIITDLNMPVMDGVTFIKNVRAKIGYKATPIVMLTTESQQELKQQAKAAGATGWIVKPFDPKKLIQVVTDLLP